MRATFALLASREIYNLVRRLQWEAHRKFRTGTIDCRLPPHVSLKQPFPINDLEGLEAYMDELARSIPPFELELTELQLHAIPYMGTDYGLLWIDVRETEALRRLHEKLNQELAQRFGDTRAEFDGPDYHFHMTVVLGGKTVDVYRKLFEEIPDHAINRRFTVQEMAMFVYDEPFGPQGEYLTYRILPLGEQPPR